MASFIWLIGVLVTGAGFFFHRKHKALERACTASAQGQVVRMQRCEETHSDTDSDGNTTQRQSVTYCPVFRYQAGDAVVEKTSSVGTSRPRFSQGQAVKVMYDPQNPQCAYIAGDKAAGRLGLYLMAFGFVVFIFGVVALFVPIA